MNIKTKNKNFNPKNHKQQLGTKSFSKIKGNNNEKTKLKKGGVGAKRTGIKSQISKFRKNMGKNKKKGDGFEFELVEKKKDGNIEKSEIIQEEKENTQEKETEKEKDNQMQQNTKKEWQNTI